MNTELYRSLAEERMNEMRNYAAENSMYQKVQRIRKQKLETNKTRSLPFLCARKIG